MKGFVRGQAYARAKLVTGTLYIVLGLVVIVRTATTIGIGGPAIAAFVLGAAMIGLGVVRWREYLRFRSATK